MQEPGALPSSYDTPMELQKGWVQRQVWTLATGLDSWTYETPEEYNN